MQDYLYVRQIMKKKSMILSMILCIALALGTMSGCAPAPAPEETEKVVSPGKVRGKVLSDNGDMLVAGILVIDQDNNAYRTTTNAYGGYNLQLAPGQYTLIFNKGIEFSTKTVEVSVESLKIYYLQDVRLSQLNDSYADGWIAGDCHQHTNYSDGADTIDSAAVANASSGLYWGFLTDHNVSRGCAEWRETSVNVYTQTDGEKRIFIGFDGVENTTEFGHFNTLGTGMTFDKYEIGFTEAERASAQKKDYAREKIIYIAQQSQRQGALAQMNHPYSSTNMGAMNFLSEDDFEAITAFDTIEIWNGYFTVPDSRFDTKNGENQNNSAKLLWYAALNQMKDGGKFIAATGGTDNHDSTGPADSVKRAYIGQETYTLSEYYNLCRYMGKYCGNPTTYVHVDAEDLCLETVQDALKNGRSFISNGPILDCNIDGAVYGDTVSAADGTVTVSCDIFCRDGLTQVRIVKNGETVKTVDFTELTTQYNGEITVEVAPADWILIEALGDWGVYAISNPFLID